MAYFVGDTLTIDAKTGVIQSLYLDLTIQWENGEAETHPAHEFLAELNVVKLHHHQTGDFIADVLVTDDEWSSYLDAIDHNRNTPLWCDDLRQILGIVGIDDRDELRGLPAAHLLYLRRI